MLNKIVCFLIFCGCFVVCIASYACAEGISVYQSVQKALEYSPHFWHCPMAIRRLNRMLNNLLTATFRLLISCSGMV